MDNKSKRVLQGISARIPKHLLKKGITREEIDTSEEELARAALASPDISPRKKAMVKKALEAGKFRRSETVENEEVVKGLDEYHTKAVRDAIKRGDLPDPNTDPFIRERNARLAKRGQKIGNYTGFLQAVKASRKGEPQQNYVLVQIMPEAEETKHGIIIPDSAKEKKRQARAVIYRIGPKVWQVKEGQEVLLHIDFFDYMELDKVPFMIGREDDILLIFE